MRNFTVVFLVLILSTGISLGQEADTSNIVVETQQVQETASVVENAAEKNTLPNWVLGFTANNLEFKSWPGTVSLQRRIGKCNFLSLGISGSNQQSGPDEYTDQWPIYDPDPSVDTVYYKSQSRAWEITVNPEISRVVRQGRGWSMSLALEGSYNYYKGSQSREEKHTSNYYNYYSSYTTEYKNYTYCLNLPVAMEKRITIKGHGFSLGLRSYLIKASTQVGINSYWSVCYSDITGNNSDYEHRKSTMPWHVLYKNPFQGDVQVQLKFWF